MSSCLSLGVNLFSNPLHISFTISTNTSKNLKSKPIKVGEKERERERDYDMTVVMG